MIRPKKITITITRAPRNIKCEYLVSQVVNSLAPKVGDCVTEAQIDEMMDWKNHEIVVKLARE